MSVHVPKATDVKMKQKKAQKCNIMIFVMLDFSFKPNTNVEVVFYRFYVSKGVCIPKKTFTVVI